MVVQDDRAEADPLGASPGWRSIWRSECSRRHGRIKGKLRVRSIRAEDGE
jgi:hypothetical protein